MNNKIDIDEALNLDSNVHMNKKNHPTKELKKNKTKQTNKTETRFGAPVRKIQRLLLCKKFCLVLVINSILLYNHLT